MAMQAAAGVGGGPGPIDPSSVLKTPYSEPLRNVVRFLVAVAGTRPSADPDVAATFRAVWESTLTPMTIPEMNAALETMYRISPQHLFGVLRAVDPATRQCFHAEAIKVAQAVKADMTELTQAAMVLRWVLTVALPALTPLPEDSQLGTTTEIRRNYAALDEACKVARPDDTNPTCVDLATTRTLLSKQLSAANTRLAALGADPADHTGAKDVSAVRRKVAMPAIALAIVFGVLFVAVVVMLGVLIAKYRSCSAMPGNNSVAVSPPGAVLHPATGTNIHTSMWGFPE